MEVEEEFEYNDHAVEHAGLFEDLGIAVVELQEEYLQDD